jgi:hypothetical protein
MLKGHQRAEALDDLAELIFNGYVSGKDAGLMAGEMMIRFGHMIDLDTIQIGVDLAHHRFITAYAHEPPQVLAAADPVRQADAISTEGIDQLWP